MLLHSRKSVEAYATFEAVLDMRRRIYGDDARYFELLDQTLVPNTVESDEVDIPHPELCLAYCHLGMNAFASGSANHFQKCFPLNICSKSRV